MIIKIVAMLLDLIKHEKSIVENNFYGNIIANNNNHDGNFNKFINILNEHKILTVEIEMFK